MIIETLVLGALQTNCYIVYDAMTKDGVVIDPSDEAVFIAEKLEREHIKLVGIIATHGHFDHILAAGELQLIYPTAPFYIHEKDMFLLNNMNSSATHWLKTKEKRIVPQTVHFLTNKMFQASSAGRRIQFQVIHTPGHTPGSICLYAKDVALFSGDTLFQGAVGRTDLSYSRPDDLTKSLKKLYALPGDTLVYPGHGDPTTIGNENSKP